MLLNVDDTGNCLLLRADLYMSFGARKFVSGPEESVGYKSTDVLRAWIRILQNLQYMFIRMPQVSQQNYAFRVGEANIY